MRKFFLLILPALLLPALCGCFTAEQPRQSTQPAPEAQPVLVFTDDLDREVRVMSAERVAVMIGSFADVWCLAGGHDSLVAAANDSWTSFDLDLGSEVRDLGAIKTPNLEALLAAEPDLIIASCNTASNLELMDTFDAAGICSAYFDIQNFEDYLNMLSICTTITGCPENYQRYGADVAQAVEGARSRQDGSSPRILCLRATGSSCTIKKSQDNLLGEMLADMGCVNVADGSNTALENLSIEAIMEADPDYIFAVLQGSDPSAAQQTLNATLLSNPAWNQLRAVQQGRFYTLDHALYNLKPNARWGEAYEGLADILYP